MGANILNREIPLGKEKFIPRSFDENNFVMDWECTKGGMVPPHFHRHMDEHFTVTKGEVTFTVNGGKIVKHEGETLLVPKMTPHSIKNNSDESIALRVTYTPNADAHKMFSAWATFHDDGDSLLTGFLKWLYLQKKLNWRKFSEPAHPVGTAIFAAMDGVALTLGKINGWDKYLDKFNSKK